LTTAKLGVDFGRVINDASAHPSGDDTSFLRGSEEIMLATPEMDGAFESLERLVELLGGRVWIVSKAGEQVQAKTMRWLAHHDFYSSTGIPTDHIRVVRERADKASVCSELEMTHFIDDRPKVLEHLVGIVPHLYLFGTHRSADSIMIPVPTWASAEQAIRDSVTSA